MAQAQARYEDASIMSVDPNMLQTKQKLQGLGTTRPTFNTPFKLDLGGVQGPLDTYNPVATIEPGRKPQINRQLVQPPQDEAIVSEQLTPNIDVASALILDLSENGDITADEIKEYYPEFVGKEDAIAALALDIEENGDISEEELVEYYPELVGGTAQAEGIPASISKEGFNTGIEIPYANKIDTSKEVQGIMNPLSGEFGPLEALNLVSKGLGNFAIGGYNIAAGTLNSVLNPKQTSEDVDMIVKGVADRISGTDSKEATIIKTLESQIGQTITDPQQLLQFIAENPFEILSVLRPKQMNQLVTSVAEGANLKAGEAKAALQNAMKSNIQAVSSKIPVSQIPKAPVKGVNLNENVLQITSEPQTAGNIKDAVRNPNKGKVNYDPREGIVAKVIGKGKGTLSASERTQRGQAILASKVKTPSSNPQVLNGQVKGIIGEIAQPIEDKLVTIKTKPFNDKISKVELELLDLAKGNSDLLQTEEKKLLSLGRELRNAKNGKEIWDIKKQRSDAFPQSIKNNPDSKAYRAWRAGNDLLVGLLDDMVGVAGEKSVIEQFQDLASLYHISDNIVENAPAIIRGDKGMLNTKNIIQAGAGAAGLGGFAGFIQ